MQRTRSHAPGILLTVIMSVVTVAFIVIATMSQMLPAKYLLLISMALILTDVSCALFMVGHEGKIRFTFGAVVAVLMTLVLAVASVYLQMTVNTLNRMTQIKTTETDIGIFVRADDPAETVDDAKDYLFGHLTEMDKENTDATIEELNSRFEKSINVQDYSGLVEMMDGLFNGETDAIIMNIAYVDMFDSIEGYEDISERIRELDTVTVKTQVEIEVPTKEEEAKADNVFSVYIGGSDSRGSINLTARNDVNIIATVNTDTKQVLLVTTPRDYFVPLTISNGVKDKLTHAGIYGIDVSKDTLAMLYDTDIDYYFRINFVGVEKVVGALGGIKVNNPFEFTAFDGTYYPGGEITLNSGNVLSYARDRKNSGGDEARGRRQMQVIEGCIKSALSPDILMRYTSILESVEDCIDMSIPYSEIATLVRQQLEDGSDWNIKMYGVSGWGDTQQPYSLASYAYVMQPDYETVDKAKELMKMVRDGEIITDDDLVLGGE